MVHETVALYCVYEKTSYHYFNNGRYDVGNFYVDIVYANSLKELLKKMGGCAEYFLNEDVFYDEKEANQVALERTLDKLQKVMEQIKK